jgi:hypothetical protein
MSSNSDGDVTTVAIELEPGWVYFKIADPKPDPRRVEFFLHRTIEEWLIAHPQLGIAKARSFVHEGVMVGIHVSVGFIEQAITGPVKDRLVDWLAHPATLFHVMHFERSWFAGSGRVD